MKKALLLSLATAGLMSLSASAQITLSQTNFNFDPTRPEKPKLAARGSMPQFTVGADQKWDFSGLKDTANYYYMVRNWEAGTNPAFGTTTRKFLVQRQITTGMTLDYYYYEAYDATGLYQGGADLERRHSFPLGAMTMNNKDSLIFEKQTVSYFSNAKRYAAKLPMTAGSTWDVEDSADLNFTMTITNFGMNNVPGIVRSFYTATDEVAGWGKMKVPSKTPGVSSEWMDVLVVKHHETWMDRIFLGGQPASAQMLAMFGMQQDATSEYNEYRVYRAGSTDPLLIAAMSNDWSDVQAMGYDATLIATGIADTRNNSVALSVYPNPVNGTTLNMQFDKSDAGRWMIQVTDAAGRAVMTETVTGIGAQNLQLNLPELSNGLYFYNLKNSSGAVMNTGKLMINR